jgi:hypothetical protein
LKDQELFASEWVSVPDFRQMAIASPVFQSQRVSILDEALNISSLVINVV